MVQEKSNLLEPVTSVKIVSRNAVRPNNYNPNFVNEQNLELLVRSILVNGWTLPIVCDNSMCIIDGFHRWLVSGREPLLSKLNGLIPIVIVKHVDKDRNIYGTITHNRARGVHQLGPMKAIVKNLLSHGKTVEEIGIELGMKNEEVFRLSDFSRSDFLELMAKNVNGFSRAKMVAKI